MNLPLKTILSSLFLLLITSSGFTQGRSAGHELVKGWHLLDKEKDGVDGISLDKAYEFLRSKNLKSKTVLVGVIDAGVDTTQEDLRQVLWNNPKEIPGNGIDDDHNGYVDDVYGWNFIGGKDGSNVKDDSQEEGRVYYRYKDQFENKNITRDSLSDEDRDHYDMWAKAKKKVMGEGPESGEELVMLRRLIHACTKSDSILQKSMGKTQYTGNDIESFDARDVESKTAKAVLLFLFKDNHVMDMTNTEFLNEFKDQVDGEERKMELKETAPENFRGEIVKDNESDINDSLYGNNDVMAADPMHGTHVAGIIGAERNNHKGMNGVADNVKIMMVRAVPNGDEHDKDIATAIRYAVDNGARVINMSFGKNLSPNKAWVDDAVKYAASRNVLLVRAAGNDAADIDTTSSFPSSAFLHSTDRATNWITVGASSDPLAEEGSRTYTAAFSNYGRKEVDVFAPGVRIYSTLPGGNQYGNLDGTSMAAPVVTGIAALLMEYFPTLTAEQIKYCITRSTYSPSTKTKKPGSDEYVTLADLSQSGGIVNAYGAVKLAYSLTESKSKMPVRSSVQKNLK